MSLFVDVLLSTDELMRPLDMSSCWREEAAKTGHEMGSTPSEVAAATLDAVVTEAAVVTVEWPRCNGGNADDGGGTAAVDAVAAR